MSVAENVTPFSLLDRIGKRIDQAWRGLNENKAEWVDGSLELAQALAEARKQFKPDKDFGQWLVENKHDHVPKNDRSALIRLASDLDLARKVLNETTQQSYRLIWSKYQSRFPIGGKPRRRTRGGAKGKEAANVALIGGTLQDAMAVYGCKSETPVRNEIAYEQGYRQREEELLDAAGSKHFAEKGALRIEDAIRIHKALLRKQFEQTVNEEVKKRIAAADDAMRASNKKLNLENINLLRIVNQRGVFTKAQFRQMQMLCHPDNSASEQTRAELTRILVQNERRLIKEE